MFIFILIVPLKSWLNTFSDMYDKTAIWKPLVSKTQTHYTLKNKGASRCHRRTFLSKWFHKEPLTSEEPLWRKKFHQI